MRRLVGGLRRRALAAVAGSRDTVDTGSVALTYDDGPHPEITPRLLDALGQCGVTATFFVVGERAVAHSGIVRRLVEEGHSVGTHSMHHRDLRRAPLAVARAEIHDGRRAVEDIVGRAVPLFRPPHGHLSGVSALVLRSGRWQTRLWTTDGYDWKVGATPDSVFESASRVEDGGVVLLHDTYEPTVEASRRLVEQLRARRLEIVAL